MFLDNGALLYDGYWKENMRHGTGKAYDLNGKLELEGYFSNNSNYVKGVKYDENGKKLYDGEMWEVSVFLVKF